MKVAPILFNTQMVKAILDNRKKETRRICKTTNPKYSVGDILWVRETFGILHPVNENGYTDFNEEIIFYRADGEPDIVKYDADGFELENQSMKWKPSIFMPKTICRIFIEVTEVKKERLHDIDLKSIKNEGLVVGHFMPLGVKNGPMKFLKDGCFSDGNQPNEEELYQAHWASLWSSINGRKSYEQNPEVWVYKFEKTQKPESF